MKSHNALYLKTLLKIKKNFQKLRIVFLNVICGSGLTLYY